MGTISHNYHIHLPQDEVLSFMEIYFLLHDYPYSSVHDVVPSDPVATAAVHAEGLDLVHDRYVVSPTDADHWTMLWGEGEWGDEYLAAFLAEYGDCTALFGHHHDKAGNTRWMLFEGLTRVAEVWDVGQVYAEGAAADGILPLDLYAAFTAQGRTYQHYSFANVLYRAYANYRPGQPVYKLVIAQRPPT